jgi:hypothetical protein
VRKPRCEKAFGADLTQTDAAEPTPRRNTELADHMTTYQLLRQDPSFRLTETGRFLLRLLDLHFVQLREWDRLIANVPPHQADSVAVDRVHRGHCG